jgi:ribonuclease HII
VNRATLFDSEESLRGKIVCGIDEVGRGPLAGPVVAAAVILPEGFSHPDIKDSKKLSSKKIRETSEIIKTNALSIGIGLRDARFIDETDILTATFKAMLDAVTRLTLKPSLILIDGNHKNPYIVGIVQVALIKGESKSAAIAASSIIAKDFRDRLMEEYAGKYPVYDFEKHKGYGTKLHLALLKKYGPSPIHRKSFCGVRGFENDEGALL